MTIETVKRIVAELTKGSDYDRDLCSRLVQACFDSDDYVEGRSAFMEKRKPVF